MANILEKGISILAGNLYSDLNYYKCNTLSFPPSRTWAFYIIKRPPNPNILFPIVGDVSFLGIIP